MRPRICRAVAACFLGLGWPSAVRAGMATPLPDNPERILRLNEPPLMRLQAISFFLGALLLCAGAVQLLWNTFRRDFPKLPRLTFGGALAGVLLWGLLFVIVLTMISGARELMTPGAWRKQGFTYRLAPEGMKPGEDPVALRRQHLERLRLVLWHFAATHHGRFPSAEEASEIPEDLWTAPESAGLRYRYVPGLSADEPAALLVCEPELEPGRRLVLRTNGDIGTLRAGERASLPKAEGRP